jgi:hypothetical protein
MSAIGLYEGAYFVGRSDCLKWLNDLTGLQCVGVNCAHSSFLMFSLGTPK